MFDSQLSMFDDPRPATSRGRLSERVVPEEALAWLDESLVRREALLSTTAETTKWLDRVRAAARVENQAAAAQLVAIGEAGSGAGGGAGGESGRGRAVGGDRGVVRPTVRRLWV
ncbi:hypothetical protein [Mycobacterium bourgelatii]|uniref:hypothetical protein n=1 Tax=Mycobacterium bourgelatii TaxID=1273442 RepID=UPI0021F39273|nr:hypothetical protein [Mycobacterium bourgelatii]